MSKKVYSITNAMNAGVVSETMYGQTNIETYANSLAEAKNFLLLPQGGAAKRGGTRITGNPKYSNKKSIFMEFHKSTTQAYLIEAGDLYMRFWTNRGLLDSGGSPYEIVTPYLESDLDNLKFRQVGDVVFIVDGRNPVYELTRLAHTNWTLAESTFLNGPFMTELEDITFTPSAITGTVTITASVAFFDAGHVGGILQLFQGTVNSQRGYAKITAVASSTSATATVVDDFYNTSVSTSYREGAFSTYRGQPSVIEVYEERLTLGGTSYKPDTIWFSASDEYWDFRYDSKLPAETVFSPSPDDGIMHTMAGDTNDPVVWLRNGADIMNGGTSGAEFRIGSSNPSKEGIEPGNTTSKRPTTRGSSEAQALFVDNRVLFVTRTGKELREIAYNIDGDVFDAQDLTIRTSHYFRFDKIKKISFQREPVSIVWAITESGKLYSMTYERSHGVVAWSEHPLAGTDVKVIDVQSMISPDQSTYDVWLIIERTINGATVKTIEYMENYEFEKQVDWFYVDSGLTFNNEMTVSGATLANPVVITSTAHGLSNLDYVKFANIGGMTELNSTVTDYIIGNVTANTYELTGIDGTAFTAYTSGGTATEMVDTISGLSYLEGETVTSLVDGAIHDDKVVSGGSIPLKKRYGKVHVGLGYTARIRTLPLETGNVYNTTQGLTKRITKAVLRVFESLGFSIGPDAANMSTPFFRKDGAPMDAPVAAFSDDLEVIYAGGYEKRAQVIVESSTPMSLNISAIVLHSVVSV